VRSSLSTGRRGPGTPTTRSWLGGYAYDLIWGSVVVALVVVAFVVPHLHLGWLTPLTVQTAAQYKELAQTAPILGQWMPHAGWATACAVLVAVAVVVWGPTVARAAPWRRLVLFSWATSAAWAMSLALTYGWHRGVVGRMGGPSNYVATVHRVTSVTGLIHGFTSHIVNGTGAWPIAVAGNPVGALLTFVGLNRVGLGGPAWASIFCVAAGTSSAAAVLIAIRALSGEWMARRAAPFVALGPVAIWIAVSADAYFAGVAAWGLALLALASAGSVRFPVWAAVSAGMLLSCSTYLDYGLALMVVPALAVVVVTGNYRSLIGATLGALAVVVTFTGLGFWWLDGLSLVRQRYWSGIATDRPFSYWAWGNLASLTCAIGIAAAIGLRRAFNATALRTHTGINVLLAAFVVVVLAADGSGLSKAETERIWLPFAVWLVAAPALLPRRSHRFCLGLQAVGALLINGLLFTAW
jgi:methylthioxylose transferase